MYMLKTPLGISSITELFIPKPSLFIQAPQHSLPHPISADSAEAMRRTPCPSLLALPPDLLPLLTSHLPYPDVLSLRLTHPYFYHTPLLATDRNIRLKVSWLLDRKARGLSCPREGQTIFRTDAEFCAGWEVRRILRDRRRHWECAWWKGDCEVVGGASCVGGPWWMAMWVGMRKWWGSEECYWRAAFGVLFLVFAVVLWFMGWRA